MTIGRTNIENRTKDADIKKVSRTSIYLFSKIAKGDYLPRYSLTENFGSLMVCNQRHAVGQPNDLMDVPNLYKNG